MSQHATGAAVIQAGRQFDSDSGSNVPGTSDPTAPDQSQPASHAYKLSTGEEKSKFWITDCDFFGPNGGLLHCREDFALSELWDSGTQSVLEKMDQAWDAYCAQRKPLAPMGDKPKFRWIHVPSNNTAWARLILDKLRDSPAGRIPETVGSRKSEFWTDEFFEHHTNSSPKHHFHAKFMKPFCEKWEGGQGNQTRSELVLMMPYLHWEWNGDYQKMRDLISKVEKSPEVIASKVVQEPLFCRVLRKGQLHVRRSLDQSFYWTLEDTKHRDEDQVIDRYARDYLGQKDKPRAILMVDQLWLWLLDEDGANPTIVTLFPQKPRDPNLPAPVSEKTNATSANPTQAATRDGDPEDAATAPHDPLDVFDRVFDYLNRQKTKAKRRKTASKFACRLIDRCAGNVVDEKLTLDPNRKYIEFYNRYIDELMVQQKDCLEKLDKKLQKERERSSIPDSSDAKVQLQNTNLQVAGADGEANAPSPDGDSAVGNEDPGEDDDDLDSFGIAREFKILKDIRDIIEELGMMIHILENQWEAIGLMGYQYRHQGKTESQKSSLYDGFSHNTSSSDHKTGRGIDEVSQGYEETRHSRRHHSLPAIAQPTTQGPGQNVVDADRRQTPKEVKDIRKRAVKRERILIRLREKAKAAEKSILHLLDLKQRQANVLEARSTRRIAQASERSSEAVMLFTIVTIIFLPLGTIASIYGMNSSDLGQMGGPSMKQIWSVLGPVSGGLAAGTLYLAFHRRFRKTLLLAVEFFWLGAFRWAWLSWLACLEGWLERTVGAWKKDMRAKREPKMDDMRKKNKVWTEQRDEMRKTKMKDRENKRRKAKQDATSGAVPNSVDEGENVSKRESPGSSGTTAAGGIDTPQPPPPTTTGNGVATGVAAQSHPSRPQTAPARAGNGDRQNVNTQADSSNAGVAAPRQNMSVLFPRRSTGASAPQDLEAGPR